MIRIGFFGTPTLASRVLSDILASASFEVAFVVSNPDKPVGRSATLTPSPTKALALDRGLPTYTPLKIRDNAEFLDTLRSYECDYFVVVAYGKILPKALLDIPKKKCINIHGSILPKYRGASPIQSALLAGDPETGVTIMEMSEGMDEGDILKIHTLPIDTTETTETLFEKFATISGMVLMQTMQELEHGGITPLPQDPTQATYCKKIEKEDGLIDWSHRAADIYHQWQAYTPWPGIYTIYEGKRLLLERIALLCHSDEGRIQVSENKDTGSFVPQYDRDQGQVVKLDSGRIGIICGEGILTLEQVKLEGKKSQNIKDFVNGNQGFIGYNFLDICHL